MLASEYGGGPRAILDGVYLDELVNLVFKITKRRAMNWKMQASISLVPNMDKDDRKKFFDSLDKNIDDNKPNKLDEGGFQALKIALRQNPKFVVK